MNRLAFKDFFHGILNSYTMVFFSKNKIFGLILLVVSFFDFHAGIGGLLSVLVSLIFAVILGLDHKKITDGLYGFNALLTGLAIGISFQPTPALYFILVFIALATLLITLAFEGILTKYGLAYLTLPFLVTTWLTVLATRNYANLNPGESGIFLLNTLYQRGGFLFIDLYRWFDDLGWPLFVKTYFRSLGAIIFQYHLFSGILIAAGLLLYSRIAFLYSLIGFFAAWSFYMVIGADIHELDYSYVGFNHILTAIAIGSFFTIASGWSLLWVLLVTPVISMTISAGMQFLGVFQLPVYSLPFNIVVLLFLYALKFRQSMSKRPELVYIQHFSPEKNLYASLNSNSRFDKRWFFPINLPFEGYRFVSQSHDGEYTHKDAWRHAWDFVILDDKEKEFERDGSSLFDYYTFNKPVVAPADGWIQEVVDHVEDNNPGEVNLEQNWGNTVIIKHTENLYSKVSHLKKQSILYPKGTYVSKGQVIAQSGNSGRSPFPHLHFQIQANPYIGSATIMYPIAQFIRFNGKHELIISGYPEKDEQITNIQPNAWLEKAFKFIPGQVISFMVNGTEGKWFVEADMYNNTSVRCVATNSVAWFRINGNIFYFTHFEGDRNSMLYYFYMSAYQVPLCYYPDLEVKDVFPPTIVPYSFIKAVQDFTAPFWLFIKPEYKSMMAQNNQHTPELTLLSECTFKFLRRNIINLQTEMIITENGITQLNIMDKGRKLSLSFFREDK